MESFRGNNYLMTAHMSSCATEVDKSLQRKLSFDHLHKGEEIRIYAKLSLIPSAADHVTQSQLSRFSARNNGIMTTEA